jgi:hypothetical protein
MNSLHLSEEQQFLGQIYVWIHRRAEYLRAKAKAELEAGSEAPSNPANEQALQPEQADSSTRSNGCQKQGKPE